MKEVYEKQNECFKEASDLGKALDSMINYENFETHMELRKKEERLWKKYEFFKNYYYAIKKLEVM